MISFLQKLLQFPKQSTQQPLLPNTAGNFDYEVKDAKLELEKINQFTMSFSRRYYEDPDPIKMAKQYSRVLNLPRILIKSIVYWICTINFAAVRLYFLYFYQYKKTEYHHYLINIL